MKKVEHVSAQREVLEKRLRSNLNGLATLRAHISRALEQIPLARRRFRVYGLKKMRAAPRRERFNLAKLRSGSRGQIENRKNHEFSRVDQLVARAI